MNRILLILVLGILALAALPFFLFKGAIASEISDSLGVDVEIKALYFGWNEVVVKGLVIDNIPEGKLAPALSAGTIEVKAGLTDILRKDKIQVKELSIDSPSIVIETFNSSGSDNNWSRMIAKHPSKETEPRQWNIETLRVTNIDLRFRHPDVTPNTLRPEIPDMMLKNVSSLEHLPTEAIAQAVMNELTSLSLTQLPRLIEGVLKTPGRILNQVLPIQDRRAVEE